MSIILALRSPGRKNTGEPLSSRVARLHKRLCLKKKKKHNDAHQEAEAGGHHKGHASHSYKINDLEK